MFCRVFYETLLQQNPASEMAQDWCLAYGILDPEEALILYTKVCKRKGIQPSKNQASPQKKKEKVETKVEIKKGKVGSKGKVVEKVEVKVAAKGKTTTAAKETKVVESKKTKAVANPPVKSSKRIKRPVIEDEGVGDTGLAESDAWEGKGTIGI